MIFANWEYLEPYIKPADLTRLESLLISRNRALYDPENIEMIKAIEKIADFQSKHKSYENESIEIGLKKELSRENLEIVKSAAESFIPWRKGPFNIFGINIDAEWRSDLKWDRFLPHMDSLKGKVVCDVGCSNGYFMFRMIDQKPEMVLGIDPTRRTKLMFTFLQTIADEKNIHHELLGFEHLVYFKEVFDVIFCMGILYHTPDPMEVLLNCYNTLKPGGQILIETMGIAKGGSYCLFPKGRYAQMKNVWLVPTREALTNMIERAGFIDVEFVYEGILTSEEQRVTKWAPGESFEEFLDPNDSSKTIEGYDRPSRIYMVARKRKLGKRKQRRKDKFDRLAATKDKFEIR